MNSELLPSATFAVAGIDEKKVEIFQGGDTLTVWQTKSMIFREDNHSDCISSLESMRGKNRFIGGIQNLIFDYEKRQTSAIARLMKKHQGNRQKMWEEFRPLLVQDRRKNINASKGFAIINGQPWFESFLQKFIIPREEMELLIIFSDGFVPFEWTRDPTVMSKRIIDLYQKGGLNLILENARQIAKKKKDSSHEDYPEATAIAIEF